MSNSSQPPDDRIDYRPVSGASLLALSLGFLSLLGLVSPLMWLVPAAGIVVSLAALARISASGGELCGRAAARWGLCLSLFFGAIGPAAMLVNLVYLRFEARELAEQWFHHLSQDDPFRAHQLTLEPVSRQPLDASDETILQYYRAIPHAAESIRTFVTDPLVRGLLALSERAEIEYWKTDQHVRMRGSLIRPTREQLSQLYTVTFDRPQGRTTFLARIALTRFIDPATGTARWQVTGYVGGVRP